MQTLVRHPKDSVKPVRSPNHNNNNLRATPTSMKHIIAFRETWTRSILSPIVYLEYTCSCARDFGWQASCSELERRIEIP